MLTIRSYMLKSRILTFTLALGLFLPGTANAQEDFPVAGAEVVSERAAEVGMVRVIARISPRTMPEGVLLSGPMLATAQAQFGAYLSKEGIVRSEAIAGSPLTVFEVDSEQLAALRASGQIDAIYEDKIEQAYLADSIPLVDGDGAWALGGRGNGQAVAILDTGVARGHPFLGSRVVSEACYSSTVAGHGATTLCPNGLSSQTGTDAATPCSANGCDHGTHVAGITSGSSSSFSGVAPDSSIIAIQVFSLFTDQIGGPQICANAGTSSPCILTYTSDQIRGLQRVIDLAGTLDIAAINMSLGGSQHFAACDADPRKDSIDQLRALGIATVIASGNNGFTDSVGAPGCISTAVTVGSTTKTDGVSSFSNSADMVDLLAPGSAINSSVTGGGFGSKNGTSMATPHVAGAFAAIQSGAPTATVDQIEDALKAGGQPITDTRNSLTKPRIDVDAALCSLMPSCINTHNLTLSVERPDKRLKKNKNRAVEAFVTLGGTKIVGATVNFSTANSALMTVSPPSATTDNDGIAHATLTGQTKDRTTTTVTAELDGTAVQETKTVRVPDISALGFLLMLGGLALVALVPGREESE